MTFCLLLTFDAFHADSCCNLSHSLSSAVFAAGIFTALLIGTRARTNCDDATNEIRDLQRELLRMMSSFVKNTPLRFERFYSPFPFGERECTFLAILVLSVVYVVDTMCILPSAFFLVGIGTM